MLVSLCAPSFWEAPLELCQGTWNPPVNVSQGPRAVLGHHRCLIKVTVTFPSCSSSYQPLGSAGQTCFSDKDDAGVWAQPG